MKHPNFEGTVIFVSDIEKSRKFYESILGQELMYDFNSNIQFESGISLWQLSTEHILNETLHGDYHSNRFIFYFETENIEDFDKLLKENSVKILHTILLEKWGQKTIRFFDPDAHLIEVGESIQTFVNRMHNEGEAIESINKKTNIPINKLVQILTEKQNS